ncbi:MAG: DUF4142 domain-containing protein [Acidobacteriota bacterium]
MKIKAFARWATLCALCFVPLTASANDKDKDKPSTSSTTNTNSDTTKSDTTKSDTTKSDMSKENAKLSQSELQVIANVHEMNLNEIEAGRLAEKDGGTQAVKSYGEMLIKDHGQNDRQLMSFVKSHNQKMPTAAMQKEADRKDMQDQKQALTKLKGMKGADFDREFLRQMVDAHDKALAKIDTAIGEVNNSELASILKDAKPVLQKHADQARDLEKNNAQAMK